MADWVTVTLSRGPIRGINRNEFGMRVQVKAKTEIELFMQQLSGGAKVPTSIYSDTWTAQGGKELEAYNVDKALGSEHYTLEAICGEPFIRGNKLRAAGSGNAEIVNLSFLKLVGISNEPDGITFGVAGIYSAEVCSRLRNELSNSITQFLRDYIVPVNISFQLISKNM